MYPASHNIVKPNHGEVSADHDLPWTQLTRMSGCMNSFSWPIPAVCQALVLFGFTLLDCWMFLVFGAVTWWPWFVVTFLGCLQSPLDPLVFHGISGQVSWMRCLAGCFLVHWVGCLVSAALLVTWRKSIHYHLTSPNHEPIYAWLLAWLVGC